MGRRRRKHRGRERTLNDLGQRFEGLGREMGAVGLHMGARCARVAADALVQLADELASQVKASPERAVVVHSKRRERGTE